MPLFALYGGDIRRPGDPALLAQLVARSGEDPARWLARRVVAPHGPAPALRPSPRTGCALEPHGQNTLFGPSTRTRAVPRSSTGTAASTSTRACGGKGHTPGAAAGRRDLAGTSGSPRARLQGYACDSFMGHHALERLAQVAADTLDVPPEQLRQAAREAFAAHGGAAVALPPPAPTTRTA